MNSTEKKTGHLILSRREGEAVKVDGPAIVEVVQSKRGRVKLSIYAPLSTQIVREEICLTTEPK